MRNNRIKLLLAGAALVSSAAYATEMRTPWISSRGPLRYTFEKLHEDKWNINWWSACHRKDAHKAFLKHGTKTSELSALIFNKSDFSLNEIFPDSIVPLNVENFNPFMDVTEIHPRVAYTEHGMTVGGRIDFPVWCNKGRVGVRVSVPFRRVEMERKDTELDKADDPTSDFVARSTLRVFTTQNGGNGVAAAKAVPVTAYRMDLLNKLANTDGTPIMVGQVQGITIFGTQVGVNATGGAANKDTAPVAIALTNNVTSRPFVHAFQLGDGTMVAAPNDRRTTVATSVFQRDAHTVLSTDYQTTLPTANTISVIDNNGASNYSATFDSDGFDANKKKTWLIFHRQTNTPSPEKFGSGVADEAGVGEGIAGGIENLLKQYTQNVFTFLANNEFFLEDQIRCGMGDIDLDVFYEHTFCDEFIAEACLGVRFPTGGDKDKYGNPYKAILGNGEHWEIKLGGLMTWQPVCWMNMKLDASYNFVLEATEHRMAAFKGAQIKNFGPRADADVDWGYFIGHVDLNFFHPKTSDIRSMVGYEIYYKTKDHVHYKGNNNIQSWLGGVLPDPVANKNLKPMDASLAAKNTQGIGHKIRSETSCQINKWFEIFAGGSYTFAGKAVMRDKDCHAGFNIRY